MQDYTIRYEPTDEINLFSGLTVFLNSKLKCISCATKSVL